MSSAKTLLLGCLVACVCSGRGLADGPTLIPHLGMTIENLEYTYETIETEVTGENPYSSTEKTVGGLEIMSGGTLVLWTAPPFTCYLGSYQSGIAIVYAVGKDASGKVDCSGHRASSNSVLASSYTGSYRSKLQTGWGRLTFSGDMQLAGQRTFWHPKPDDDFETRSQYATAQNAEIEIKGENCQVLSYKSVEETRTDYYDLSGNLTHKSNNRKTTVMTPETTCKLY
jgi:hypothetical protein